MSKSKMVLLASFSLMLLNPAFSGDVRDAKTDTRRLVPLRYVTRNAIAAPQVQTGKSNQPNKQNQSVTPRK